MPVFLAGISTILGAIMFLRFGYAVGHAGFMGAIAVIILGHLVTVPTALAIAEIATNRKVEGGGEYFIISRSFGTTIGSVIGYSLYLSQAISVAFYLIALAEAFAPLSGQIEALVGLPYDPRMISLPATIILLVLMLFRGAAIGVKVLYVVVLTLAASLVLFLAGTPIEGASESLNLFARASDPDSFFVVFAICFPAFTGMTAGVGLSGDLANPRRSIPLGTMLATGFGFLVYLLIVAKLATSAPIDLLAEDPLVMAEISLWPPMILIGLGAATISSAIGSILVAPRTLQALGADRSFPSQGFSEWVAAGKGAANEPRNATILTGALAIAIVFLGNVDFVARLISMFFMVTYGSLCAISFLENFAARPSYRPSFRSRWYISLFGACMCLLMMFQMDPIYAILAIAVMVVLYRIIVRTRADESGDLAAMFEGVITQMTRYMQIKVQRRRRKEQRDEEWRPSVIMVSPHTFDRRAPLELLRWVCHRHGFGTYLHFIQGQLDDQAFAESEQVNERLIELGLKQDSPVYMDTIVSPSMVSALAQSLQIPGVSGIKNNSVLFEISSHDPPSRYDDVANLCLFSCSTKMALMVLRHGDLLFGERQNIHIWLSWNDNTNASLMVLLAYILLGHPDWKRAEISVFAAMPSGEMEGRRQEFDEWMARGRVPISEKHIRFHAVNSVKAYHALVSRTSAEADLTIIGFGLEGLGERRGKLFTTHKSLGAVLYVHTDTEIAIG